MSFGFGEMGQIEPTWDSNSTSLSIADKAFSEIGRLILDINVNGIDISASLEYENSGVINLQIQYSNPVLSRSVSEILYSIKQIISNYSGTILLACVFNEDISQVNSSLIEYLDITDKVLGIEADFSQFFFGTNDLTQITGTSMNIQIRFPTQLQNPLDN